MTAPLGGEPRAGITLADLLARRGRLRVGEVVTLVAPLAAALADLHAHGTAHGGVSARSVVFTLDGRPVLAAPAGVAAGVAAGEQVEVAAADDVRALARLGLACLGSDAGVLGPLLSAAHRGDCSAARLADAVLAAATAEPVRFDDTADEPVPSSPTRLALTPAAVLAAAVLVAVVAGVAWARHGTARSAALPVIAPVVRTTPTPTPRPGIARAGTADGESRWTTVVRRIERRRAHAFLTVDVAALDRVYPRTSALRRADLSTLREFAHRGLRAHGLVFTVRDVRVRTATLRRVVLRVVDAMSGYTIVDAHGAVVGRHPLRRARPFRWTLVRRRGRWCVLDVRRT